MVIVQQGPLLAMFPSATHVVPRQRYKYMEGSDREARRMRERKEGRGAGGCERRRKKMIIIGCGRETN